MQKLKTFLVAMRNLVVGANLFSLALLFRPRTYVSVVSTVLFNQRTLSGSRHLEQKNPSDLIKSSHRFALNVDTDSYFWGPDSSYVKDIVTLCIMTRLIEARTIFEIGTLDGYTALHFAMNTDKNGRVYTLDLPAGGRASLRVTEMDKAHQRSHAALSKYRWLDSDYEGKVHCLYGDSANFDYSPFAAKIDLFFIDGAHSYEYVKSDTLNAFKCVREGGLIVWHDYGRLGVNGVSKWLHELNRTRKIYSVPGSSLAFMLK